MIALSHAALHHLQGPRNVAALRFPKSQHYCPEPSLSVPRFSGQGKITLGYIQEIGICLLIVLGPLGRYIALEIIIIYTRQLIV